MNINKHTDINKDKTFTPIFDHLIHCEFSDVELFKVVRLIMLTLAFDNKRSSPFSKLSFDGHSIEEAVRNGNYFYSVSNDSIERTIHIGRDSTKKGNPIQYIIQNNTRINWALKEGFSLKEAYSKVGNLAYARDLAAAQQWVGGERETEVAIKGKYLTGES